MTTLLHNVTAGWLLAPAASSPGSSSTGVWLGFLLPVLIVTADLLALLWWLRKGPGLQTGRGSLRVVQAVAVGARERVVIVEAQDRRLLVGVTAQRIELLAELRRDEPVLRSDGE